MKLGSKPTRIALESTRKQVEEVKTRIGMVIDNWESDLTEKEKNSEEGSSSSRQTLFHSSMIPATFSILTPKSARDVTKSFANDITIEELISTPDVSEAVKKVSKSSDKQLKDLTVSMLRRYKEDQIEANNKKIQLESTLQDTQTEMKKLKDKLNAATNEVMQARQITRKMEDAKGELENRVAFLQKDAQTTAKAFQSEILSLQAMSSSAGPANLRDGKKLEESEVKKRIEEAREQSKRETEKAMRSAQNEREEKSSSLQSMRSDLLVLRRHNAALQVDLELARKRVQEAEERIKAVEKDCVQSLADQAVKLAEEQKEKVLALRAENDLKRKDAMFVLRESHSIEKQRLEAEKSEILEVMKQKEKDAVEELHLTKKEFNTFQKSTEEDIQKNNEAYELKIRTMVLQINRSKEEQEGAVSETESKYTQQIKHLEKRLVEIQHETEIDQQREVEKIIMIKELEKKNTLYRVMDQVQKILTNQAVKNKELEELYKISNAQEAKNENNEEDDNDVQYSPVSTPREKITELFPTPMESSSGRQLRKRTSVRNKTKIIQEDNISPINKNYTQESVKKETVIPFFSKSHHQRRKSAGNTSIDPQNSNLSNHTLNNNDNRAASSGGDGSKKLHLPLLTVQSYERPSSKQYSKF